MTTEALNDFTSALRADEAMAKGLVAAVAGKSDDEAVEIFAAYGRDRGYDVDRQDAEALLAAAQAGEGALSDEQLDAVAGGFMNLVLPALGSLGDVAGAIGGVIGGVHRGIRV